MLSLLYNQGVIFRKEGITYMENNVFGKRLQKLMDEHELKATDIVQLSKKYDETGKGLSKDRMGAENGLFSIIQA